MRARVFLAMVAVTLTALLVVLAVANRHAYDAADRRGVQIGQLARQVRALQHQLRRNDLVPVVPESTTTTAAPRSAAPGRRTSTTDRATSSTTTSTTTTTAPQRPPRSPPSTVCVLVACTKGAS